MPHDRVSRDVRFADFEADLAAGELFRDGKQIPIQNKPFRILEMLLRSGGELVRREQILGEVWPDAHVEQRAINTSIRKLRRALGDDAAAPRIIETVGSRGHRLMVPVEFGAWTETAATGPDPITVAVLPFPNLGSPDGESFSCGFAEQMIVQLRRLSQKLSIVVPAGPNRGSGFQNEQLGTQPGMNVDYVLEGSVLPGTRNLRVTARLICARDQVCVWSESYAPRKRDVLEVQDDITRQIARAVLRALPDSQQSVSKIRVHEYEPEKPQSQILLLSPLAGHSAARSLVASKALRHAFPERKSAIVAAGSLLRKRQKRHR
jgi:TolB-like protein